MYLKRLDLQGFKSFPEKVRLEFNKGITTVVGPNGSGKSNISDSIRWVLGEQKVKSLRGDKMEDVIFSGTANRKPLGFAEVSITIDNEDLKIPLEYSEIKVTRTVYRSGESKYMINGTACRLKDIHELFMDTGIGKEGYSIIGQGKIDEILSSKSEDRRRLFEEAAGIVKYRNRRFEAISKLEKEHQNLLRVEDIINELSAKIEPLCKQSENAKKYLSLKEELKRYEINSFCIKAENIKKELKEIEDAIEISSAHAEEENEGMAVAKKLIEDEKNNEEKYYNEIKTLDNDISSLIGEIERIEGNIKLYFQESQHLKSEFSRLSEEETLKEERLLNFTREKESYVSRIEIIENSLKEFNDNLKKEEEHLNKISEFIFQKEEKTENYKSDILESMKNASNLKSNIERIDLMNDQFIQRLNQLFEEKESIKSKVMEIQVKIKAFNHQINEEKEKADGLEKEKVNLEKRKAGYEENLIKTKKNYDEKSINLNESKSKLKVFKEMKKDFEGFYKSVKSILKLRGTKGFEGIYGAVGEVIKVEKKYETAIEIALGSSIQNIITQKENDAKIAIEYLKKNNLGRATFLPLSAISGKSIDIEKNWLLKEKGFCGIAKSLVLYDEKYENIINNILGRVIVVENIDDAISLSKKTSYKYKIVTLDGDVLSPGGIMTGGSIAKKTSGVFARNREIDFLEENIGVLEKELKTLISEIDSINHSVFEDEKKIADIKNKIQNINFSFISKEQEIAQSKEFLLEKSERLKAVELEENTLFIQTKTANQDKLLMEERLEETQSLIDKINFQLENYQENTKQDKIQRDEILNTLTAIKVSISSFEQEKTSAKDNVLRIEKEEKTLFNEIREIKLQKEQIIKTNKSKADDYVLLKENLASAKEKKTDFQSFRENINNKLIQSKDGIKKLEEKNLEHFETLNKLKNHIFKLETKRERLFEDNERLFNFFWEEYEITYQKAMENFDEKISLPDADKTAKRLKEEIKSLGTVNVSAIEEYKEVNERYIFLTSQRDDIRNAEEKLKKIINDLDILMQRQFKEQFQKINKNFNMVFSEMFGGGSAYLKMEDESNVLESGIEIIAQPPGKSLQNMMLLSGGERALTAIAILFAILKMKPSPFCILDEIEAALDDANVKRFAHYLKDFSDGTQFIVITHRKGTMECADVMYGVTMQEQGISKILSVKLEDQAV